MAILASLSFSPVESPVDPEGEGASAVTVEREDGLTEPSSLVRRLRLLEGEEIQRGEMVGLPTPVGRVEVMLLWHDAQLQLGLLEDPLKEAVVAFAPAGTFSRTERSQGRVVLSLPVARF